MASGIGGCCCVGPSRECCVWGEPGCPSGMMASLVPATSVAALTIPHQNVTYTVLLRVVAPPMHLPTKQRKGLLHQIPPHLRQTLSWRFRLHSPCPTRPSLPCAQSLRPKGTCPQPNLPPHLYPLRPTPLPPKGHPRGVREHHRGWGALLLSEFGDPFKRRHISHTAQTKEEKD